MTNNIHTIQQQHLHIKINGVEADAWCLQNRLSEWCHTDLLFALEEIFNQYSTLDIWSIDRLEIDAGTVALNRLEQDLTVVVAEVVAKKLREQILNHPSSISITDNIRHKTIQQNLIENFIYFLNTGRLPWSVKLEKNKSFEKVLLDNWRDGIDNIHIGFILDTLHSEIARKRLVKQFSPLFMNYLLEKISPDSKKIFIKILPKFSNSSSSIKAFEQQLWETVFYFIVTGKTITETAIIDTVWNTLDISEIQHLENELIKICQNIESVNISSSLILKLFNSEAARKKIANDFPLILKFDLLTQFSPETKKIVKTVLATLNHSNLPVDIIKSFEQQLWEIVFYFISTGKTVTEYAIINETWHSYSLKTADLEKFLIHHCSIAIDTIHSHAQNTVAKLPLITTHTSTNQQQNPISTKLTVTATDIKEGIYIENAGLILLHPLLPRFFTALGIAEEDQLIKPERAICLLHFLTTGLLIAPEYELTLAKLLCNIPLEMPVESDVNLTESEIEEAEALLNAVIRHWDALRNTSIDGLRGEFLFRFGKLSMREDGDWLLQVENKTVDILLNQLPWGISMIKLPWMPKMLWVEWNY
jgi:hypothetical protein